MTVDVNTDGTVTWVFRGSGSNVELRTTCIWHV